MKKFSFKIIALALLSSLTACKANNSPPLNTHHTLPSLQKIPLSAGKIRQIASDNQHLYTINDKGELWQNEQKLAENFSTEFLATAHNGKFASADSTGFLSIWQQQKLYQSDIALSPNSALAWDGDCVIAIAKLPKAHPVRACIVDEKLTIQAERLDIASLPDARPTLWQDKVAIYATPDDKSYRHGVLGDKFEARSLYILNNKSLQNTVSPIHLDKQVFEHNQVQIHDNQLATVIAGGGNGASVALFDANTGQKIAQSEPLPNNRWQSPFAFHGTWYSVKMPHILGQLVRYSVNDKKLSEKILTESVSNHMMGSYDTQLAVQLADKVLLPKIGFRELVLLDTQQNLSPISPVLPARIVRGVVYDDKSAWLLENGEVWAF